MTTVDTVPVDRLAAALGVRGAVEFADAWRTLPLRDWVMDADDRILRFIFRAVRPVRHLEFGTWMGDGVLRCVEECDATVWTINPLEGEKLGDGSWAYGTRASEVPAGGGWTESMITGTDTWVRTDAYGMIGRKYLNAGCGGRVCQIYADSRDWDTRAYPAGFFDTAFIDGGHAYDVVANDTAIATRLVRSGGLVMWHDYCPREDVTAACASTRDVVRYIEDERPALARSFNRLLWIEPSWLLVGVRGGEDGGPQPRV